MRSVYLFIFRCAAGGLFTLVRAEHVKSYPIYEFRRQMALNLYSINNFRPLGATAPSTPALSTTFISLSLAVEAVGGCVVALHVHDDRISNDMNIKISKTKRQTVGCVCV